MKDTIVKRVVSVIILIIFTIFLCVCITGCGDGDEVEGKTSNLPVHKLRVHGDWGNVDLVYDQYSKIIYYEYDGGFLRLYYGPHLRPCRYDDERIIEFDEDELPKYYNIQETENIENAMDAEMKSKKDDDEDDD